MKEQFIEQIAVLVQKYASQFGIAVHSPIIAQAILESASGTSNKVKVEIDGKVEWRHNYFGLKWRDGRCAISNDYFEEWTSEQRKDGSRYNKVDRFCKFNSMEDCIIGYFQWTNIPNYANLKGVTDPQEYLEKIKADGYATSLHYVENLMNVISTYNLTKYDKEEGANTMRINVHAGHNPDGKVACGAIGLIKESTENRNVKNEVVRLLRELGHTVYDCTVDNGTSKNDVLKKIVSKCNAHSVDLDVSIHFNAGASDKKGNGITTGTEVFIYNSNSKAKQYAQGVARSIAELGFKLRDDNVKDDVKNASYLYVLKNTNSPAMLIECCFVDDKDDVALYNYKTMAEAIVKGITGQSVTTSAPTSTTTTTQKGTLYRVQVGAFSKEENAKALQKKLKASGYDAIIVN